MKKLEKRLPQEIAFHRSGSTAANFKFSIVGVSKVEPITSKFGMPEQTKKARFSTSRKCTLRVNLQN